MNFFKACMGLLCFGITITVVGQWHDIPASWVGLFLLSGTIGLGIGDILLLKAFSELGPGRTLILFSFQPLFLGVMSYYAFGQEVDSRKFMAIFFFILCVGITAFESFRRDRRWQVMGIALALGGILLDATGLVITRYTFNNNPQLTSLEGNFYRCVGAVLFFLLLSRVRPYNIVEQFKSLNLKSKTMVFLGGFLGTYLSLALYLHAVQRAHLASLAGVAITGTLFTNILECIISQKWPSKYLLISLIFFGFGMNFLVF
jgi:drug/metabolite transporter (DMT)-like permease